MAKKSKKEKASKDGTGSKSSKAGGKNKKNAGKKAGSEAAGPDLAAVAKKVKAKAVDLASNPLVAEIVAATLVAAAAAIKDPKKAHAIAASAGDELGRAAKGGESGSAMWQLAMDVAKRSIGALSESGDGAGSPQAKAKKKT